MTDREALPPRPKATIGANLALGLLAAWATTSADVDGLLTALSYAAAMLLLLAGVGLAARAYAAARLGEVGSGLAAFFGAVAVYQAMQCEELACLGAPLVVIFGLVLIVVGLILMLANHAAYADRVAETGAAPTA